MSQIHPTRKALNRIGMTLRTPSTLQFKWNAMDRLWMPVVTGPFNFIYKQRLLTNLRKLGLQYTDTFSEWDTNVQAAAARLSDHDKKMRYRRIRRAIDLDIKKEQMPEHLRNYDPFEDVALNDLYWDHVNRKIEKDNYR